MSEFPLVPDDRRQRGLMVMPDAPQGPYGYSERDGLHLRTILLILRRNALLILTIVAVTAGAAWYRFSKQLPQYKAAGLVRLVDARRSLSGGLASGMGEYDSWRVDPLRSQLEVLKGRTTLGGIVDSLGLRLTVAPPDQASAVRSVVRFEAPEEASATIALAFRPDSFTASAGGASAEIGYGERFTVGSVSLMVAGRPGTDAAEISVIPRESAISALNGGLQLRLRDNTDAVDVEYTANDPRFARQVVNAAIVRFQGASAMGAREESRRRRIFLEEQLGATEATFRQVQAALSDFRARRQLFSSREQISAQQEGLRDLDVRRAELLADKRIYDAALTEIIRPGGSRSGVLQRLGASPAISGNPVVAQLYSQLLTQQSTRDSIVAGGGTANHPDVVRLDNAIVATEGRLVEAVRSHVAGIDSRIAALTGLRASSVGEMQTLPATEAEEVRLVQQVEATARLGDQLREELQRARISEAVEAGQVQVIHEAPMAGMVGAPMSIKMAIALFFGLGLGVGAAFLRNHMDTTIRDREEVERILRAPKLATIPRIAAGPGKSQRVRHFLRRNGDARNRRHALVTRDNGGSWEAEAFRTLRTNLIFSQTIRTLKRVVITSSVPGEGKTTTASNLAVTFAQQGLRVLLVDCDLRKPAVHRLFDLHSEPGFTQLVLGFAKPEEAIRGTSVKGLFILPAGTLPPNPAELLGGERVREFFENVSADFDILLIDTSPIMAASDAAILASHSDGVLLVVRAGFADRNAVQLAGQQLASVGARVIGAVFNDADARAWPYERSYHYQSYHKDG
jgi:capsular exopolysaccharide synthesis family protein